MALWGLLPGFSGFEPCYPKEFSLTVLPFF